MATFYEVGAYSNGPVTQDRLLRQGAYNIPNRSLMTYASTPTCRRPVLSWRRCVARAGLRIEMDDIARGAGMDPLIASTTSGQRG
jgi:hypothetical protein